MYRKISSATFSGRRVDPIAHPPLPSASEPQSRRPPWVAYHHDPSMSRRTLANSNFRREYDKMEVPERLMSLGFHLGAVL